MMMFLKLRNIRVYRTMLNSFMYRQNPKNYFIKEIVQ